MRLYDYIMCYVKVIITLHTRANDELYTNIKTIIVRYETHANYSVYMLFDEIIWENNW